MKTGFHCCIFPHFIVSIFMRNCFDAIFSFLTFAMSPTVHLTRLTIFSILTAILDSSTVLFLNIIEYDIIHHIYPIISSGKNIVSPFFKGSCTCQTIKWLFSPREMPRPPPPPSVLSAAAEAAAFPSSVSVSPMCKKCFNFSFLPIKNITTFYNKFHLR